MQGNRGWQYDDKTVALCSTKHVVDRVANNNSLNAGDKISLDACLFLKRHIMHAPTY